MDSIIDGDDAIYQGAIDAFGEEMQYEKAAEECGELSSALMRWMQDREDYDDVVDEIADVIVTCRQLAFMFGEEEVLGRAEYKMDRLEDMIAGEVEGYDAGDA